MTSNHNVQAWAALFAILSGACSSSSSNGAAKASGGAVSNGGASNSGGTTGSTAGATTGGAASTGTAVSCTSVTPCGGGVVGTWTANASCLAVKGPVNVGAFGLGCATAQATGSLQVTGTFTANADGTYKDNTTVTGTEQLTLDASCLFVSGTITTCERLNSSLQSALGYATANCTSVASGGCNCTATVSQSGGLGLVAPLGITADGNYTTAGNEISTTEDGSNYSYCVSGNTLTLSPEGGNPAVLGTVTFQKPGTSTGTGGAPGAGGSTGVGGVPQTGGSKATGGAPGAGGSTGVGGTTASSNPTGGASSAGGSTAVGGKPGTGGSAPTTGGATGATTGGKTGTGGDSTVGGSTGSPKPCDIYQTANAPCVGAYSTVRALFGSFSGNLYQVRKTSDKTTKDIPVLEPGGYANSKVQDDFCGTGACTISIIYDQSPKLNHLPVSPKTYWLTNGGTETDAKAVKINVGGHAVYGVKSFGGKGNSYRAMKPSGTAVGDQPEAMYEVVDTKTYNAQCCNDFGNAETTGNPDGAATMEAIYFGNNTMFGSGGGSGPWLLADLEAGTFGGSTKDNAANTSITYPAYATLMLKGFAGNRYAMKAGDAQTGNLVVKYDGVRPNGYSPMKKQGSIVLGTGGDGSFYSTGVFFEGAITIGCPSDAAVDDAIQANIVAAGYGK